MTKVYVNNIRKIVKVVNTARFPVQLSKSQFNDAEDVALNTCMHSIHC